MQGFVVRASPRVVSCCVGVVGETDAQPPDKENKRYDSSFRIEIYLHRSEREIDSSGIVALEEEDGNP